MLLKSAVHAICSSLLFCPAYLIMPETGSGKKKLFIVISGHSVIYIHVVPTTQHIIPTT